MLGLWSLEADRNCCRFGETEDRWVCDARTKPGKAGAEGAGASDRGIGKPVPLDEDIFPKLFIDPGVPVSSGASAIHEGCVRCFPRPMLCPGMYLFAAKSVAKGGSDLQTPLADASMAEVIAISTPELPRPPLSDEENREPAGLEEDDLVHCPVHLASFSASCTRAADMLFSCDASRRFLTKSTAKDESGDDVFPEMRIVKAVPGVTPSTPIRPSIIEPRTADGNDRT